jgi:hypothetical protein
VSLPVLSLSKESNRQRRNTPLAFISPPDTRQLKKLLIIPGADHLFEEPGALEKVALAAAEWFESYLMK